MRLTEELSGRHGQLEEASTTISTLREQAERSAAEETQLTEGLSGQHGQLEEANVTISSLREEAERSAAEVTRLTEELSQRPDVPRARLRRYLTLVLSGPPQARLRRDIRKLLKQIGDGN